MHLLCLNKNTENDNDGIAEDNGSWNMVLLSNEMDLSNVSLNNNGRIKGSFAFFVLRQKRKPKYDDDLTEDVSL